MIKINLLGDESVEDTAGQSFLLSYAASVFVTLLVCFFILQSVKGKISTLSMESEGLERELNKLKETTKEVKQLEAMKTELSDKLLVIAMLKKNKNGPVRILDDLNIAIPDRAWLNDITEKTGVLSIHGFALDNQAISEFMRSLEGSQYFEDVGLLETKQSERDGVKIKEFTVQSKISYSGHFERPTPAPEEKGAPAAKKPKAKKSEEA